jgi:hypothetical protein
MWHAVSATRITGPIFLDTVNSERYHGQIIEPFFEIKGREEEVQVLTARQCKHQLSVSLVAAIHNTFGTLLLLILTIDTTHTHKEDNLKEIIW